MIKQDFAGGGCQQLKLSRLMQQVVPATAVLLYESEKRSASSISITSRFNSLFYPLIVINPLESLIEFNRCSHFGRNANKIYCTVCHLF